MGAVYEVHDHLRNEKVALKVLSHIDPLRLQMFKQEFRGLADIVHPGLVRLYELFGEDGRWFFTMELVNGVSFRQYVLGTTGNESDTESTAETVDASGCESGEDAGNDTLVVQEPRLEGHLDDAGLARLRTALAGLGEAVSALHDRGKLHCDLKPSNVLVTASGQVKVLDFGLVSHNRGRGTPGRKMVTGTIPYMSPEQTTGDRLTPASDWYAVGVMLFEVLAGRLPHSGTPTEIMLAKVRAEVEIPLEIRARTPAPLVGLCASLLRRVPGERATGEDLAAVFGTRSPQHGASRKIPQFVGREAQLRTLAGALELVQAGRTAVVHVCGPSGMGKSALVRRFLKDAAASGTIVLEGRCLEREAVPFKSFDSLVDDLVDHLLALPELEVASLLPRHVGALARVFPVIERIPAVAGIMKHSSTPVATRELRRQAFAAFRNLVGALSDRQPLVLAFDDLQWGDLDSLPLFDELVRGPDSPRLLVLLSYRDEAVASSDPIRLLREKLWPSSPDMHSAIVEVGPLSPEESVQVALACLEPDRGNPLPVAHAIAAEARGVPFFVEALALFASAGDHVAPDEAASRVSVDELIRHHAGRLSVEASTLLTTLAVYGGPAPLALVATAAGLPEGAWAAAVELNASRLLRFGGDAGAPVLECYHDRIREAVADGLLPDLRTSVHSRVADGLLALGGASPELLLLHLRRGGRPAEAAFHARDAARNALGAMAFSRAATCFRIALSDGDWTESEKVVLLDGLANSLAGMGRGADAAETFLSILPLVPPERHWQLRFKAAEQLLCGGHVDRGMELLDGVLRTVGTKLPRSAAGAVAALLWLRFRRALRGTGYRRRDPAEVDKRLLARADLFYGASVGLAFVKPVEGAVLQTRSLLESLKAGDPERITRALVLEAGYQAAFGGRGYARAEEILHHCESTARELGSERLRALTFLGRSVALYQQGRYLESHEVASRAHSTLLEHCSGHAWELSTAAIYSAQTLGWLGRIPDYRLACSRLEADARERGDLHAVIHAVAGAVFPLELLDDRPVDARIRLLDITSVLPSGEQHLLLLYACRALCLAGLYAGDLDEVARWTQRLQELARNPTVGKIVLVRIYAADLSAQHCLLSGVHSPGRWSRVRKTLLQQEERLVRFGLPWTSTLAASVASQRLMLDGDPAAGASRALETAVAFDSQHMPLHGASLRWCAALAAGTPEEEADAHLDPFRKCGIRSPKQFASMLTPAAAMATGPAPPRRFA
jgi:serine/threonine protein kinase/tetratricopeptide (TPR) repeat protein